MFPAVKKPLPGDTDTTPRFRYIQAHPRKRVLVLDTSGSMTVGCRGGGGGGGETIGGNNARGKGERMVYQTVE